MLSHNDIFSSESVVIVLGGLLLSTQSKEYIREHVIMWTKHVR